jgi:hypothetical protein
MSGHQAINIANRSPGRDRTWTSQQGSFMTPKTSPLWLAITAVSIVFLLFHFFPAIPLELPKDKTEEDRSPLVLADTGRPEFQSLEERRSAGILLPRQIEENRTLSKPVTPGLPPFHSFVAQVSDGEAEKVRGVYVPGVFALPVIQQPETDVTFVSDKQGVITEFRKAARNNITGLLAHNYLSGGLFYELSPNQEVRIIYGDGTIRLYEVSSIHSFQKLKPLSVRGPMIDLGNGMRVSTREVFNRFYNGEHQVTFQTSLEREGNLNWGLTFIVANPLISW